MGSQRLGHDLATEQQNGIYGKVDTAGENISKLKNTTIKNYLWKTQDRINIMKGTSVSYETSLGSLIYE